MPKDFITLLGYSEEELLSLLDLTDELCKQRRAGTLPPYLKGKSIALIWDAEGFRNRVAFELGIAAMGGIAVQVPGRLDERETIEDVAAYLCNWFDAIVSRARLHSHMERLASAACVPVINARTNHNHPCEILGDLAYIRARRGRLDELKVAFVGEATNLCHPWFEAAVRLPIEVVQVCPEGYFVDPGLLTEMKQNAVGKLWATTDFSAALKDANVVYTDCWPSHNTDEEYRHIQRLFSPYQVTAEGLKMAAADVLFLPCPPVHRGEEVSEDAMQSSTCCVYEAKEYLLHAQNAVLVHLLSST